jgi:hypothetical protein
VALFIPIVDEKGKTVTDANHEKYLIEQTVYLLFFFKLRMINI